MGDTDVDLQRLADDGCPNVAQEPDPPLTGDELVEIDRWAKAYARAGSGTAQLVIRLLGAYKTATIALARAGAR